jgi:hypothetical protein
MQWLCMRRGLLVSLMFAGLAGIAACGESALEPLPLQITLESNRPTAAPGDTVNFVVTAQGGTLLGVDIDYGDTSTEQYGTAGARTARVTFHHAYTARGTYQVHAMITDGFVGQKVASIEIRVN